MTVQKITERITACYKTVYQRYIKFNFNKELTVDFYTRNGRLSIEEATSILEDAILLFQIEHSTE
jgi:hypothetical protein